MGEYHIHWPHPSNLYPHPLPKNLPTTHKPNHIRLISPQYAFLPRFYIPTPLPALHDIYVSLFRKPQKYIHHIKKRHWHHPHPQLAIETVAPPSTKLQRNKKINTGINACARAEVWEPNVGVNVDICKSPTTENDPGGAMGRQSCAGLVCLVEVDLTSLVVGFRPPVATEATDCLLMSRYLGNMSLLFGFIANSVWLISPPMIP